jgi:hypothetical protein
MGGGAEGGFGAGLVVGIWIFGGCFRGLGIVRQPGLTGVGGTGASSDSASGGRAGRDAGSGTW